MSEERIWNLIAKKLGGEATQEDLVELFDLLKENPEVHYSLEIFHELWCRNEFARRRPIAAYARLIRKMEQQGIVFPPGGRNCLYNKPPMRAKGKGLFSGLAAFLRRAKKYLKTHLKNNRRTKPLYHDSNFY